MSATDDLVSNYQHVIADVTLVMGSKGVFDVRVDDQLIFSKGELGRHAEPGEVLVAFEDLIGPNVAIYGT